MKIMKNYGKKFQNISALINHDSPKIIEIGSHYGEDTLRMLNTFPNAKIYCFEPDERNNYIFKKYVQSKQVQLNEFALSNVNGISPFYRSYTEYLEEDVPSKYDFISIKDYKGKKLNNSGASSLKKGYENCLQGEYFIETKRFDEWYIKNDIGPINLAWIDVQGAEYEVLDGIGEIIRKIHFIWIEYGENLYEGYLTRNETIELLFKKEFEVIPEVSSKDKTGDLMFKNSRYANC